MLDTLEITWNELLDLPGGGFLFLEDLAVDPVHENLVPVDFGEECSTRRCSGRRSAGMAGGQAGGAPTRQSRGAARVAAGRPNLASRRAEPCTNFIRWH